MQKWRARPLRQGKISSSSFVKHGFRQKLEPFVDVSYHRLRSGKGRPPLSCSHVLVYFRAHAWAPRDSLRVVLISDDDVLCIRAAPVSAPVVHWRSEQEINGQQTSQFTRGWVGHWSAVQAVCLMVGAIYRRSWNRSRSGGRQRTTLGSDAKAAPRPRLWLLLVFCWAHGRYVNLMIVFPPLCPRCKIFKFPGCSVASASTSASAIQRSVCFV